jgi:hypothetical protein
VWVDRPAMGWQFYLLGPVIMAAVVWSWGWAHGFDLQSDSDGSG